LKPPKIKPEWLFLATKRSEITSVILHVLNFHNVQADFIIGENYEKASLSTENDFVIIEAKASENLENLRANIALITNISNDENIGNYKNFIYKITWWCFGLQPRA
jgi:UDP-N-acetylmuramate-alanine ligase